MRFAFAVDGGQLPLDNHHNENQIRPIAVGRNNWLFAGGLRAGKRAAACVPVAGGRAAGGVLLAGGFHLGAGRDHSRLSGGCSMRRLAKRCSCRPRFDQLEGVVPILL